MSNPYKTIKLKSKKELLLINPSFKNWWFWHFAGKTLKLRSALPNDMFDVTDVHKSDDERNFLVGKNKYLVPKICVL